MLPDISDFIIAAFRHAAVVGPDHLGARRQQPSDPKPSRPAVPIRRSVSHDYIVCLEDGVQRKVLTGYLMRRFKLTPQQYRTRWGLPHDYPMVAPSFTERRSLAAKQLGLGRSPEAGPASSVNKRRRKAQTSTDMGRDAPAVKPANT
jgi:predicted transcriptional regulator